MSNLYGYDDLTSEEVEPIDSDEEDQKRSSRNPDKSVKKKVFFKNAFTSLHRSLDYHFPLFGEMISKKNKRKFHVHLY